MKFWASGEVHGDIGDTTIRLQKIIEAKINDHIEDKEYGDGVTLWGFISIVMPSELLPEDFFKEIKKYHKSKREVEFRLKIDYKELSNSDEIGKYRLICRSILRSVEIAKDEFKLSNFDFNALEGDLKECFQKKGWID